MKNKSIVQILSCLLVLPLCLLQGTRSTTQSRAHMMRKERYGRTSSTQGLKRYASGRQTSLSRNRYNLVRGRGHFQSGARRLPMGGRFAQKGRISRGRDHYSIYTNNNRGQDARIRSRANRYESRSRMSRTGGVLQEEDNNEYIHEEAVNQSLEEKKAEEEAANEQKMIASEKNSQGTQESLKENKEQEGLSWDSQFSVKELQMAVVELQKKKEAFRRDKQMDSFAITVDPEQYDSLIKAPLPAEVFENKPTISLIELHRKINDYLAEPGLPKSGMNIITFKENEPHLLAQSDKKVIVTSFELYNDYQQQLNRIRPVELQRRKELFEEVLAKLSEGDKKRVLDSLNTAVILLDQQKSHLEKLSLSITNEMKAMSLEDLSNYIIEQMGERKEAVLDGWSTGLESGHFWATIYQSYVHPFGERKIMLERSYHEFYFLCMSNEVITADEKIALFGRLGDPFDYEFIEAIRQPA